MICIPYMYHQFNIQQFYLLPTQYICVFCVDLRKKKFILFTALKYHTFSLLSLTLFLTLENKYISEITLKLTKLSVYED